MLVVLLILTLFLLFYVLIGRAIPLPDSAWLKDVATRFALPAISVVAVFFLTTLIFSTPLAGLPWAVAGWFLPQWVRETISTRQEVKLRALARDFITSSAGLYSAGQVTSEVMATIASKFPEPLGSEFRDMLTKRRTSSYANFPEMFESLGEKYNLSEFKAVSAITASSERAGGPHAAAAGLKRLGQALRERDRRITERKKSLIEVQIASVVVIALLIGGLLLDITSFRDLFTESSGKMVLGVSSAITVGLIFMAKKIGQSTDLT